MKRVVLTIADWLLIGLAMVGWKLMQFVEWMDEKVEQWEER
jgi:hypothetical protein